MNSSDRETIIFVKETDHVSVKTRQSARLSRKYLSLSLVAERLEPC